MRKYRRNDHPEQEIKMQYRKDKNGNDIFVEKDRNARMKQKLTITQKISRRYR